MEMAEQTLRLIPSQSLQNGYIVTQQYLPETGELSIYSGNVLRESTALELIGKIGIAFSTMSGGKAKLILEMMIDEKFTEQ